MKLSAFFTIAALSLPFGVLAKQYLVVLDGNSNAKHMANHVNNIGAANKIFNLNAIDKAFSLKRGELQVKSTLNSIKFLIVEADEAGVEVLKNNPMVQFVEEEQIYAAPPTISAPQVLGQSRDLKSTKAKTPWGIKAVNAQDAWNAHGMGRGVKVMVLDTGIDKDHPDISGNFVAGQAFAGNSEGVPYPYFDDQGHGTHVAGTVLGAGVGVWGVAPEASLYSGRVCAKDGCPSGSILSGLDWAVTEKVDVVNLSLGGNFPSPGEQAAYQRAKDAGLTVVAASGNGGIEYIGYPANFDSTIAVGAVDPNLARASFSQYGAQLDLVAPGVQVLSSVPEGTGRASEVTSLVDGVATEIESNIMAGAGIGKVEGVLEFAGLGKPENFETANVSGKIALISRGEITFADKIKAAEAAGAIGAIVYNNEDGPLLGTLSQDGAQVTNMPVATLTKADGEALKARMEAGEVAGSVGLVSTSFAKFDGTSMASPHVAGVAALIIAANPRLSPDEVRTVLKRTATPLTNDSHTAAGLLNAEAAVKDSLGRGFIVDDQD